MSDVWNKVFTEEERDQLGNSLNWRYEGANKVVKYAREHNMPLSDMGVSMDRQGRLVLVGNPDREMINGTPVEEVVFDNTLTPRLIEAIKSGKVIEIPADGFSDWCRGYISREGKEATHNTPH